MPIAMQILVGLVNIDVVKNLVLIYIFYCSPTFEYLSSKTSILVKDLNSQWNFDFWKVGGFPRKACKVGLLY